MHRRERLVQLMAQMAGGDKAAIFTLAAEFGAQVGATVRRQLAHVGVQQIDLDELHGLVVDACMELYDCAQAWDPAGGALPWVWAERRVARLVSSYVGQHHDELDEPRLAEASGVVLAERGEAVPGHDEPEPLDLLAALADGARGPHPLCRLVQEALELVSTDRDRRLLLEVAVQASLGDRSPSATAAALHGMRADAVRQVVKRTKDRLRTLAATEARFAPLAELPLLAA